MHSIRLFLYVLVAAVSFTITAAADDGYEDNDDSESATAISPGVYPGLSLEDDDWFSFEVNNHDLKVTAWYKENNALQLELWASGGSSPIDSSAEGAGEEQVAASGLTGTYYVRAVYAADTEYALALVAQPAGEPSWLYMLYLAGDNNLDSAGDEDIEEMAKIGSTENVWLLVLQDKWSIGDTSIQFVRSGEVDVLPLWVVDRSWSDEVDTGDPSVAQDWAEWAIRAFSIDSKLMLDFWNHGGGIYGCCWDDNNNHNFLSYSELSDILQALSGSYGKLELVGFDACLMQMAETLVELGDYAKFIVAAEETEPGDGWEYNYFLDDLVANPGMDGGELGEAIVVGYFELYGHQGGETLSVVDASYRAQITQLLDDFASKALDDGATADVAAARNDTYKFYMSDFIDLSHFASNFIEIHDGTELNTLAQEIVDAVDDAVYYREQGSGAGVTRGMSIYLPSANYASEYDGLAITATKWDELAAAVSGSGGGGDGGSSATLWWYSADYEVYDMDGDGDPDTAAFWFDPDTVESSMDITVLVDVYYYDELVGNFSGEFTIGGEVWDYLSMEWTADTPGASGTYEFWLYLLDNNGEEQDLTIIDTVYLVPQGEGHSTVWLYSWSYEAVDSDGDTELDEIQFNYDPDTNAGDAEVYVYLDVFNNNGTLYDSTSAIHYVSGQSLDHFSLNWTCELTGNYTFTLHLFDSEAIERETAEVKEPIALVALGEGDAPEWFQVWSFAVSDRSGDSLDETLTVSYDPQTGCHCTIDATVALVATDDIGPVGNVTVPHSIYATEEFSYEIEWSPSVSGSYYFVVTLLDNMGRQEDQFEFGPVQLTIHDATYPVSNFTVLADGDPYNDTNIIGGITVVTLDGSGSSDLESSIVTWYWEFGSRRVLVMEGEIVIPGDAEVLEEGQQLRLQFNDMGELLVRLTVTDAAGHSSSSEMSIMVADTVPPEPAVSYHYLQGAQAVHGEAMAQVPLRLDASLTRDNLDIPAFLEYEWYFGDGKIGTGMIVEHTYEEGGNYQLHLIVRDSAGNEARLEETLHVVDAPTVDLFVSDLKLSDGNPVPGQTITLNALIGITLEGEGWGAEQSFMVAFYVNEQSDAGYLGSSEIGEAFEGVNYELQQEWTATAGKHTIYVVVDSTGNVAERYENNNVFALELEVASKRQPGDESGWSNGPIALLFTAISMGGIAIYMGLRLSKGT